MLGGWRWGVVLAGIASLALAATGGAGEYHWGATLICAECHVLSSELAGRGEPTVPPPSTPGGAWTLPLRKPGDALCLDCHDGRADAPDVLGDNTGIHVRQAGALPTGAPPYGNTNGHDLGVTTVPLGGNRMITLHCTTCHSPHGTPYYRNLPQVTYAKERNDPTKDVFMRSWVRGQIAVNYSAGNVDFNEPKPGSSAMADFCEGCHSRFHSVAAFLGAWLRHPTAAANISPVPGGHSSLMTFSSHEHRVKVLSPAGDWGPTGGPWAAAPPTLTPTCITCHRAHGNRNPFALISPSGMRPITEEGDGKVPQALCLQCHAQAGPQRGVPIQSP